MTNSLPFLPVQRPRTIDPMRLGFDFDGVIANTAESFVRIACEEYDHAFTLDDITNFEIEQCIGIERDLVTRIFADIMRDSLSTCVQPMEGSVEVLNELARHAPITIITARSLEQPVIDWCDRFFPETARQAIRLVAMGDHDDKLRYIRQHDLQYFIDDRAETCTRLAAARIVPLVYSHPWNRNRHTLPTVENWQEIRSLLDIDHSPSRE